MANPQKVETKEINYADLVRKVLGEEANKPEAVYEFSNGREFKSTDRTDSGIYKR